MSFVRIAKKDLLWLAGLLEGEGCFSYQCSPSIALGMTDRDIVARVADMFGKNVRGPYRYGGNKKSVYYTGLFGGPAVDVMRRLLPHMGQRRTAKIQEILAKRLAAPGKSHGLGKGSSAICHPTRRHYAFHKCRSCYRKMCWAEGRPR